MTGLVAGEPWASTTLLNSYVEDPHVKNKEWEIFFCFSHFIFDPGLLCKTFCRLVLCFVSLFPTIHSVFTPKHPWGPCLEPLGFLNADLELVWNETLKVPLPVLSHNIHGGA